MLSGSQKSRHLKVYMPLSTKQDLLTTLIILARRGTNLEIIVTALFGIDIYIATDSYRPGSPTWLKYSPNAQATTELTEALVTYQVQFLLFHLTQESNGWNLPTFQDATSMLSSQSAVFRYVDHSYRLLAQARLLKFDINLMHGTILCTTGYVQYTLCEKGVNNHSMRSKVMEFLVA